MKWKEIMPGMFAEKLSDQERKEAYTLSESDRRRITARARDQ